MKKLGRCLFFFVLQRSILLLLFFVYLFRSASRSGRALPFFVLSVDPLPFLFPASQRNRFLRFPVYRRSESWLSNSEKRENKEKRV